MVLQSQETKNSKDGFLSGKTDFQGNQNKIKVLQIIRNEKEITRSEIIRMSGLSAPTVTRIVESLVNLNLIQTEGLGSSIGGRPPQLIRFRSKENYVIGIDLGATFIRSALSNLDGEFIFEVHVPTNLKKGFDGVMEQVGELIGKLSERARQNSLPLWGIGIAVCGMVNKNTGIVEYSPIFGWENVTVQEALLKYTNLNIAIGNVTHLIALGELLYGVGKQFKNFICLNLGYGIGSGIIIDSKLFSGTDGIAGEVGHIVLDKNCNRKGLEGLCGTLEALASGYGLADIARENAKLDSDSVLHVFDPEEIDAKIVFEAASNGDRLANEIIDGAAGYLSIGIDTLIKLFNTECVVLAGGLVQNGDSIIEKIRLQVAEYSLSGVSRSVPIVKAGFGVNAALMGSFSLILERILLLESID
ncbi:MAG: ROK family transcriptional regulator [Mariniphaga sp.]